MLAQNIVKSVVQTILTINYSILTTLSDSALPWTACAVVKNLATSGISTNPFQAEGAFFLIGGGDAKSQIEINLIRINLSLSCL